MKLTTSPTVRVIQHSVPIYATIQEIANQSSPEGVHTEEPDATVLEVVPIFSGRVCYQSFGSKAGRKTAEDYLGHIKEVMHFSVVEHSSVTFYLEGVSRSFTHELVRHRMASYSQLSQRFVAPDDLEFIIPPAQRGKKGTLSMWKAYGWFVTARYKKLLGAITDKMSTSEKKAIRESARSVLPNATATKIVVTMNLRGWYEFLQKRTSPAADAEIREVSLLIQEELVKLAPHVFGG